VIVIFAVNHLEMMGTFVRRVLNASPFIAIHPVRAVDLSQPFQMVQTLFAQNVFNPHLKLNAPLLLLDTKTPFVI
jgi:hypothetical protein